MDRIKKICFLLLAATAGALFFCNSWQGYRYERLINEVSLLQSGQGEWLDKNKKTIIGIAVLSSPQRIEKIAESKLSMQKGKPSQTLTVTLTP